MNIFERASRRKLRFESDRGDLTAEQLWDLPLIDTRGRLNLDQMARGVNTVLKSLEGESFVEIKPDPRKIELELQLDILKHVIASKMADAAAAEKRAANVARQQKILAALANREDQELTAKSKEELLAELEQLSSAA